MPIRWNCEFFVLLSWGFEIFKMGNFLFRKEKIILFPPSKKLGVTSMFTEIVTPLPPILQNPTLAMCNINKQHLFII